jgi:hypothetical protein
MKTCKTCQQTYILDNFHKGKAYKDGHRPVCKYCMKQYQDNLRVRNPNYDSDRYFKKLDMFKLRRKEQYIKHRDSELERSKIYSENHREELAEKSKIYYRNNRERILQNAKTPKRKESNKKYLQSDRGMIISRERCARRRSMRLQATPHWLTKNQILEMKEIYKKCREIEKETGKLHAVDHIIPVKGFNSERFTCTLEFTNTKHGREY